MADPIGSLVKGAFGSDKVGALRYNNQANKNLNYLGGKFQSDDSTMAGWLNDYVAGNKTRMADLTRLGKQAEGDYSNLYQTYAGYDPLSTYERLRGGNLDALSRWSGTLEDAGRRQDNLAAAAMGLGGRPDGSYERTLRADRVSRNVAPVLGSIFSNLGSDTSGITAGRTSNLSNLAGLIDARTGTAMYTDGMELNPIRALQAIRGDQYGQLGDAVDVARANTAGWQQKRNAADRFGDGMNAANDAAWQNIGNAMKVYSSLYGGGMLGGMGGVGGMGGGLDIGSLGGGGGGGGGIMSMFGGGQPAGGNPGYYPGQGGSNWNPYNAAFLSGN